METRTESAQRLGLRDDWRNLVGHVVEVWRLGTHISTGIVEQAAEDSSILWIAADGARTRRLFDKSSGYRMWFMGSWLRSVGATRMPHNPVRAVRPVAKESSDVPSFGHEITPCSVSNWVFLNEGELVLVQRMGMRPIPGVIETISDDAFIFWVWLDGEGRILVSADDGTNVWRYGTPWVSPEPHLQSGNPEGESRSDGPPRR